MKTILIANRGEIALRIINTCLKMGINTVAIYSPIDRYSPHVDAADLSVELHSNELQSSYLDIDQIINIAKQHQVDGIHPGYGFLSENAHFSQACRHNNLIFIGPGEHAIEIMGSKSASKRLLQETDVPLVPGFNSEDQTPSRLIEEAHKIGFPLLIKASAGGGGKGMRVVDNAVSFEAALLAAKREAKSAFGDDHVILERYIKQAKHIEIQIFRDHHGNCLYLFERDCSMQRRHQKIIEEAPSTQLTSQLRGQMGQSAVAVANAINYSGAGTVEFLLTPSGDYFFMEMNTRLQVEHPVTEMICGVDLVAWQIDVARNKPLALNQSELNINGHSIEVRIYAETPANAFLPSSGRITHLAWPSLARIDSGVAQGDFISQLYDPMIAKLIVHGKNRGDAINALKNALAETHILGVDTNVNLLRQLVNQKDFMTDNIDTTWLDRNIESVLHSPPLVDEALIAQAFLNSHQLAHRQPTSFFKPLISNVSNSDISKVALGENVITCASIASLPFTDISLTPYLDHWAITARNYESYVKQYEPNPINIVDGLAIVKPPMSGRVISVLVETGDAVELNAPLFIIEAMKMEYTVLAEIAGIVALRNDFTSKLVDDETIVMEIYHEE